MIGVCVLVVVAGCGCVLVCCYVDVVVGLL